MSGHPSDNKKHSKSAESRDIESCNPELLEDVRKMAAHEVQGGTSTPLGVLMAAQDIMGYLPQEVLVVVAEAFDMPLAEVSGIASFYRHFERRPRGRHIIRVCTGTACHMHGGEKVAGRLERLLGVRAGQTTPDGRFSIRPARCMGVCSMAPAMTIDGKIYKNTDPDRLKGILDGVGRKPEDGHPKLSYYVGPSDGESENG